MLKVVNTTVPKNNPFHQYYPFTTFGVGFYHPPGFTEKKLIITYPPLLYRVKYSSLIFFIDSGDKTRKNHIFSYRPSMYIIGKSNQIQASNLSPHHLPQFHYLLCIASLRFICKKWNCKLETYSLYSMNSTQR